MSPSLQQTIPQADFSAGMNRDVSPPRIPQNGAFDLVNVLLDEDGSLYERGGSVYLSGNGMGSSGLTWITDIFLKPGRRTVVANSADFGVLNSSDTEILNLGGAGLSEPVQSAVLEDLLFIGGRAIYAGSRKTAVYSTGTAKVEKGSKIVKGSGTTWNTLVDQGMLFHIGSERVYEVESYGSTTELTLRDAYEGTTGEGKTYSLNPLWTIGGSDPYETWDAVTVVANRIVIGSGSAIKFTEIKNPHTYTNSLGTTNEHTLPEGIEIVSLNTVGQTLIVGTTGGIWTIDGMALDITDLNGNPQHRIQQLTRDVIPAGAPGITSSEQKLIIPATDGIYLMDGVSQPSRISKPIDRYYRRRIQQGRKLGQAKVARSHYFLPITEGGNDAAECLVCRLDFPISEQGIRSYPWTRQEGDAGQTIAFALRTQTGAREPKLLGAQSSEPSRVVDCSGFFEPTETNKNDADGSHHYLDIITRDIPTGAGTVNVVRSLILRRELVAAASGEAPLLKTYESDGDLLETNEAKWDEVKWNEFNWATDDEVSASFSSLECDCPAGNERDIHKCRVNKEFRYARFRIRRTGDASYCGIREINLRVRPSQAVRR